MLVAVFLIAVLALGYYFLLLPQVKTDTMLHASDNVLFGWKFPITKFPLVGSSDAQVTYSTLPDPNAPPKGLPIRLKIPIIGVDSAIEDALITKDGRMDVPANSVNVAWFALGPVPGRVGSGRDRRTFWHEERSAVCFLCFEQAQDRR